jgi:hypothetical protein
MSAFGGIADIGALSTFFNSETVNRFRHLAKLLGLPGSCRMLSLRVAAIACVMAVVASTSVTAQTTGTIPPQAPLSASAAAADRKPVLVQRNNRSRRRSNVGPCPLMEHGRSNHRKVQSLPRAVLRTFPASPQRPLRAKRSSDEYLACVPAAILGLAELSSQSERDDVSTFHKAQKYSRETPK